MDYQIAIPSYKRADLLLKKTLPTLARHRADPRKITVWVANEEEYKTYKRKIGSAVKIEIAVPGKFQAVKHYNQQYDAGTRLLNIDDDIMHLKVADGKKLKTFDGTIDDIAHMGFETSERHYTKLWGINPVAAYLYMKPLNTIGLRFICGNFYGSYAGDPILYAKDRPHHTSGDDFETTIRSFIANGAVTRLDWIAAVTTMFAPGGIDAELQDAGLNRQDNNTDQLLQIAAHYPDLVTAVIKTGGEVSLKLKPITLTKEPVRIC